jgi:hypothetical protein
VDLGPQVRCQRGLVGSGCGVRCRCVTVWRRWLGSVAEREQRWTFVLPLQSTYEGSSPHQLWASGRGSGLRRGQADGQGRGGTRKVHATTVNRTDCGFRAAKPFFIRFLTGLIGPRVTVLGGEFAGVVEAVGSGVTSFKVGDRVVGYSEGSWGAHAEYLSMPRTVPGGRRPRRGCAAVLSPGGSVNRWTWRMRQPLSHLSRPGSVRRHSAAAIRYQRRWSLTMCPMWRFL